MKKLLLAITAIAFMATVPAFAQPRGGGMGPEMMQQEREQQESNVPDQEFLHHMQAKMMKNYTNDMMGAGRNMMGNYGMMPMMGGGYGMPPCTIGSGRNMMGHHGMMPMMGGYGMLAGPGFMGGHGMMQAPGIDNLRKYENFAKETKELRRKLHNLMFDYGEARWNPETTVGELNTMAEEMSKLRQEIQQKMVQ